VRSFAVITRRPEFLWILGLLCLATALALLAPLGWPFELFAHFRVQYAVAAMLLAAWFIWRRRRWAVVLALALAAWHAWPGAERLLAAPMTARCEGPAFSVVTANVQFSNDDHTAFLAWLDAHPADLVVVQEVTEAWARSLVPRPAYPHYELLSREDPYGIAVLSRWPLESVSQVDLAGDGLPSLAGVAQVNGEPVRFVALHTHWPVLPELARARDTSLRAAAELVRSATIPVVLLGDLNLTPDAPAFHRLLDESGLQDVMEGRGWRPTWRAGFWPFALRIDHVLASPGLCVEQAEVGPDVGSDHRPVFARLALPRQRVAAGDSAPAAGAP
jgi:endonuclease/exonuclease/phosphatase (EEP) superfamily protein YafD